MSDEVTWETDQKKDHAQETLPTHNAEPEAPQLWATFLIVVALCLSVFLIALDYTIVTTAIPRIT